MVIDQFDQYAQQNLPYVGLSSSKDFGFHQHMTEIQPIKVVTVTLTHPVVMSRLCNPHHVFGEFLFTNCVPRQSSLKYATLLDNSRNS